MDPSDGQSFQEALIESLELQCHRYFASKLLPFHALTAVMHNRYHRTSLYHGACPKYPQT